MSPKRQILKWDPSAYAKQLKRFRREDGENWIVYYNEQSSYATGRTARQAWANALDDIHAAARRD